MSIGLSMRPPLVTRWDLSRSHATAANGADIAYDPAVDAIRASPGHQVELRDGQTRTITITVTSPDGRKQQRYIIRATRAAAPSTDATLSQLNPDPGDQPNL